jgi:hypothetical protein
VRYSGRYGRLYTYRVVGYSGGACGVSRGFVWGIEGVAGGCILIGLWGIAGGACGVWWGCVWGIAGGACVCKLTGLWGIAAVRVGYSG